MTAMVPGSERPIEALPGPAFRARRATQVGGLSRRALLRRALGGAIALWVVEMSAGTLGFVWSSVSGAVGRVRIGTFSQLLVAQGNLPIIDGFPAYVPEARSFIVIVDPTRHGWTSGIDLTGEGSTINVRALSQRCPHLGCRPNPCLEDFWFHCPCHQSRYDRLGIKPEGVAYGPASRGMDRFAVEVDDDGVLFVDTSKMVLGPLPIALGEPGLIPPLVEGGCV
jgi:cytochrome b6-f complex iron-sulfur subunit